MAVMGEHEHYIARRVHTRPCDLCGEPILIGQKCLRWVWFDDTPLNVRVHVECQDEAVRFKWYDDPDGWGPRFPLREERMYP